MKGVEFTEKSYDWNREEIDGYPQMPKKVAIEYFKKTLGNFKK